MRSTEKSPEKSQGAIKRPRKSPKEYTEVFGGEIEISECGLTERERASDLKEKELQEVLISEYNKPTDQSFLIKLRDILTEKESLKISLCTAMLLSVVFNQRVSQIQEITITNLSSFISISNCIPFPATSALRTLNNWYFIARCIDRMLSVEIENCMPRSAYFPAIQEFDHETNTMNLVSSNLAPKFLGLYTRPTIKLSTPVSDKLTLFVTQLSLLNKIFEFFTNRPEYANKENGESLKQAPQDLSNEQMEELLEEAKNISGVGEYAEYEHLGNVYYKIQRGIPINQKTEKKVHKNYKKNDNLNSIRKEELNVIAKSLKFSGRSQNSEEHIPSVKASDDKLNQSARITKLKWSSDKSSVQSNKALSFEEEEEKRQDNSFKASDSKMESTCVEKIERMDTEDARSDNEMQVEAQDNESNDDEVLENEPERKMELSKDSINPNDAMDESKDEGKLAETIKKDGKTKKAEKDYERNMKGLLKKQSLIEARSALDNIGANAKKKREKLVEQIKKTEDWLELYKQRVGKPTEQLKELKEQIPEVPLRVPEMERLFEQQRDSALWRIKFDSLVKKSKKSKKKNGQATALDEFESLFQEAENLRILDLPDEPRFKELKDKYDKVRTLNQKLESSANDLNVLRKIKKELSDPDLSCTPLADSVAQRIELNEQMLLLLETNVGADVLEEFLEQTRDKVNLLELNLYQKLQEKASEAQKLKSQLLALGPVRKTYEYEEVDRIKSIFPSIKAFKLDIPNQQLLSDVLSSFNWLSELERLIQVYNKMNPKLSLPNSEKSRPEDRLGTEEIVNFCTSWILSAFNPQAVDDNTFNQLKKLLQEGSAFRIADQRIETLFKFLIQEISECEGAVSAKKKPSVAPKDKIDIEIEIDKASQGKEELEVELENDFEEMVPEMDDEAHSLQDWNMLYNKVASLNVEEVLRRYAEAGQIESSARTLLVDMRQKLLTLIDEYENNLSHRTELEGKVVSLRKYQEWLDWLVSACEWSNDMTENSSETYRYLQEFYLLAKKIEIPKHWGIFKQIEEHFTLADTLFAEYKQKFQHINSRGTQSRSPLKDSIHKQIESNKLKPLAVEAKKMRDAMKTKLAFINCEQELGNLDRMIEQYSKWKSSLEAYIKSNSQRVVQTAVTASVTLNDCASIEQQLNRLKTDYLKLCLRDEQDEKTLTDLDCQLRSYLLMKNTSKASDLKEWKKMVKYAEDNSSGAGQTDESTLINRVKTEFETSKGQHNIVKDLKKLTQRPNAPLPLSEIKKIQAGLAKSPIRIPEDEQFLEELIQKAEKLKNQGRQLCTSGKKKPFIEFTSALDQIKHLIISLPEEEQLLEDAIGSANKIAAFIKENPKLSPTAAERTLREYNSCPVTILEGEKLLERYEKSKALYEKLKARLSELENVKCNDYDQLKEVSNGLDEIHFDFEADLTLLKAQAYNLRIRHLQNLTAAQESNKNSAEKTEEEKDFEEEMSQQLLILNSQTVKSMVREGYSLRKALVEPQKGGGMINQAVFWIENISKRIDEKVREINTISSIELLDRMPRLLLGFIDLSQNFIERKAAIAAGVSLQQSTKPAAQAGSEVTSVKSTAGSLTDLSITAKGPQKQLKDFFRDKKEAPKLPKEQSEKPKEIKKPAEQQTLEEKKHKLQLKLLKSESENNEKRMQLNLQPSKPSLKAKEEKPKPLNPAQNQARLDKMFNISKSNQLDEASKQQDKLKRASSSNELTLDVSKDNANKIDLKKSKAMLKIREILQNNNTDLSFDASKTTNIASRIVSAFPILDQSKEKFAKFETFFKEVTKHTNIYRMLTKKSFPPKIVSILFAKSPTELARLEKKLANKPKDAETKKVDKEEDVYEGQLIKKKLKATHMKKEAKGEKENKESKSEKEAKAIKEPKNPLADLLKLENSFFEPVETSQLKKNTTANSASLDAKLKGVTQQKAKLETSGDFTAPSPSLSDKPVPKKPLPTRAEEKKSSIMIEESEEDKFSEMGSKEVSRNFNQVSRQPVGMDFEDMPHEKAWNEPQNKPRKSFPTSSDNYPRTPKPYDPDEEIRGGGDGQVKNNQFSKNFKGNTFQKAPPDSILKPSKLTFDPALLKRIEPEILAPYRDNREGNWRNRKWNQNVNNEPEAPKSGRSTPEIEPCSRSVSQDNVEKFEAFAAGQSDMNSKKQQFQTNNDKNNRKGIDYDPLSVVVEEPEKIMPVKAFADNKMEIEKPALATGQKEKERSFDAQLLLNQPLINLVSQSETEPAMQNPRMRKGFNNFPRTPNPYPQNKTSMNIEYPSQDNVNASDNKQNTKPKFYETPREDYESIVSSKDKFREDAFKPRETVQQSFVVPKPENQRFEQNSYQNQEFTKPADNQPLKGLLDKTYPSNNAAEAKGYNQNNQNGFRTTPMREKISYDPEAKANDHQLSEVGNQNPEFDQDTQNDEQFEPKFQTKSFPQRPQQGFRKNASVASFSRKYDMPSNQYSEHNSQNQGQRENYNYNQNQNRAQGGGFYNNKTTQYPRNNMNNKWSNFGQQNQNPQFEEEQSDQTAFNANSFDRFPKPQNRWQTPGTNDVGMNNFQQQQSCPEEENPDEAPENVDDTQQEQHTEGLQNYDEPVNNEQHDDNYPQQVEQYNQPRFGGRFQRDNQISERQSTDSLTIETLSKSPSTITGQTSIAITITARISREIIGTILIKGTITSEIDRTIIPSRLQGGSLLLGSIHHRHQTASSRRQTDPAILKPPSQNFQHASQFWKPSLQTI
ncbi:unnamed protein product [Sphagnum balticum]